MIRTTFRTSAKHRRCDCGTHILPGDRIEPTDQHLGSFVVREGRWLVWHMYRKEIGHGR